MIPLASSASREIASHASTTLPVSRRPHDEREVTRRVTRRRQQRQAWSELLVAGDQSVARVGRPVERAHVTVVAGRPGFALGSRHDDRRARESVHPADVVDVAVRQHELRDVLRGEPEERELGARTVLGADRDEPTEGVETVSPPGRVGVVEVRVGEPGVDEDDVLAGDDDVAADRYQAPVLGDLERAVVEDREPVARSWLRANRFRNRTASRPPTMCRRGRRWCGSRGSRRRRDSGERARRSCACTRP